MAKIDSNFKWLTYEEMAKNVAERALNEVLYNGKSIREWIQIIALEQQPSSAEKPNEWIPVKWHTITDEEREREGYPKDWVCHLDCIMPYDGQRILITTKGGFVELDECYSDDGCTFALDSGYDWVDDVLAWMPLPQPYQSEIQTEAEGSDK